jgi:hypothetical protein
MVTIVTRAGKGSPLTNTELDANFNNMKTILDVESIIVPMSDETSNVTTGVKMTFRMPYAFTLTSVRASLNVAQSAGSVLTVNIKKNGTTILSTLITFDNTELTTLTAATAPVISVPGIANDDILSFEVTQVGTAGAKGLKVTLLGYR